MAFPSTPFNSAPFNVDMMSDSFTNGDDLPGSYDFYRAPHGQFSHDPPNTAIGQRRNEPRAQATTNHAPPPPPPQSYVGQVRPPGTRLWSTARRSSVSADSSDVPWEALGKRRTPESRHKPPPPVPPCSPGRQVSQQPIPDPRDMSPRGHQNNDDMYEYPCAHQDVASATLMPGRDRFVQENKLETDFTNFMLRQPRTIAPCRLANPHRPLEPYHLAAAYIAAPEKHWCLDQKTPERVKESPRQESSLFDSPFNDTHKRPVWNTLPTSTPQGHPRPPVAIPVSFNGHDPFLSPKSIQTVSQRTRTPPQYRTNSAPYVPNFRGYRESAPVPEDTLLSQSSPSTDSQRYQSQRRRSMVEKAELVARQAQRAGLSKEKKPAPKAVSEPPKPQNEMAPTRNPVPSTSQGTSSGEDKRMAEPKQDRRRRPSSTSFRRWSLMRWGCKKEEKELVGPVENYKVHTDAQAQVDADWVEVIHDEAQRHFALTWEVEQPRIEREIKKNQTETEDEKARRLRRDAPRYACTTPPQSQKQQASPPCAPRMRSPASSLSTGVAVDVSSPDFVHVPSALRLQRTTVEIDVPEGVDPVDFEKLCREVVGKASLGRSSTRTSGSMAAQASLGRGSIRTNGSSTTAFERCRSSSIQAQRAPSVVANVGKRSSSGHQTTVVVEGREGSKEQQKTVPSALAPERLTRSRSVLHKKQPTMEQQPTSISKVLKSWWGK
ncbi:hypothetical protein BCR34DRAFT_589623 [Clohesyomyces aquaticus]|uniref:Uncharacterized protein n=1 Tax=Clohesyomyces aquaticus TaxID=1231657 RepID=A0A1Y1ZFI5_9PLEO|nr:hypothetical protein BCR34DRAFT_589623 [Clohesyomyces aquaticus]